MSDSKLRSVQYEPVSMLEGEDIEPPIDSLVDVKLTDSSSPSCFHVQMLTFEEELMKLENEMQIYYAFLTNMSSNKAVTASHIKIGQIVVVLLEEDNSWFRARVESVNDQWLDVFYIDYGNRIRVKISDVKKLVKKFSTLPALAIPCFLPGLEYWPANFNPLEYTSRNFQCKFLPRDDFTDRYPVKIFFFSRLKRGREENFVGFEKKKRLDPQYYKSEDLDSIDCDYDERPTLTPEKEIEQSPLDTYIKILSLTDIS